MKRKLYMMLAVCASFVGMTHAKLDAVSSMPPLLVVSCVRGAINSVTLSTNTIATALDFAISTSGTQSQLIGLVEWNATKQATAALALQIVQIVQIPDIAPAGNAFPAFTEACGGAATTVATRWQAITIFTIVDPANPTAAAVYINPTELVRVTIGTSFGSTIMQSMTDTYCGQIGVLAFYAVDDANNASFDGTYRANFMITFNAP